jgi:hypothetical protein
MRTGVIETPTALWKSAILPLNYVRKSSSILSETMTHRQEYDENQIMRYYKETMLLFKQKIELASHLPPTWKSMRSFILGGFVALSVYMGSDEIAVVLLQNSPAHKIFSREPTPQSELSATKSLKKASAQSSSTNMAAIIANQPRPVAPKSSPDRSTQRAGRTQAVPDAKLLSGVKNETNTAPKAQTPAAQKIPVLDMEEINKQARGALVNILCTTAHGGSFQPITASGVLIGERGIILTNAHVAQYILLANYTDPGQIDCVVRTGSPAQARYRAEILYISSQWIEKNQRNLTEERPMGTGEYDYALLQIVKTTDPQGVTPTSFPTLELETEDEADIINNETVLIAGYPAGFLGGITVQKNLYISSTISKVGELFTFDNGSIDLFSLGGTILAQKGASGGAVVRQGTGKLSGIVTTSLEAPTTDRRDLRAISIAHIQRTMTKEIGISLSTFLLGDTNAFRNVFSREKAPQLAQLLIDSIKENNEHNIKKQ